MNVQNCKTSLLKLVGFLGVASASALLFLPGLVQAQPSENKNTILAQAAPGTEQPTTPETETAPGTGETTTPETQQTAPGTGETTTPETQQTDPATPGTGQDVDTDTDNDTDNGAGQTTSPGVQGLW